MKTTPLHDKHIEKDAKMGGFAGYDMPLYYEEGVIKEHNWVRSHAGLFDVSHMGQLILEGPDAYKFLERVTPSGFKKMKAHRARYTVLTNEKGGIIDDLIVIKLDDEKYFLVVNAGRVDDDFGWLQKNLAENVTLRPKHDYALLALQGPRAAAVLYDEFGLDTEVINYMTGQEVSLGDTEAYLSRLGYTGEDGFEISVPADKVAALWDALLTHKEVKPIGLASRDSLRLEMGYCLYGHDIDEKTTPVEAGLSWVISKHNNTYYGADIIQEQLDHGTDRKRVGFRLLDKGVAREEMTILNMDGEEIGAVTSGGFSPILKQAIGIAYVKTGYSDAETPVQIDIRGRPVEAKITAMPFIQPRVKIQK